MQLVNYKHAKEEFMKGREHIVDRWWGLGRNIYLGTVREERKVTKETQKKQAEDKSTQTSSIETKPECPIRESIRTPETIQNKQIQEQPYSQASSNPSLLQLFSQLQKKGSQLLSTMKHLRGRHPNL